MSVAKLSGNPMLMIKRIAALILIVVIFLMGALYYKKDQLKNASSAYLFAYLLVIMDLTRSLSEDGVLTRRRDFPDAKFKGVVRPNVDTLYSSAFIAIDKGPWVFEMAENTQRYEVMQFMDGWTNVFASLGTRTQGTVGGKYLIVGPNWNGSVPVGLVLLRAPTNLVWMIGRTQTNGVDDLTLVHQLQNGLKLRTLHDWLENKPEKIAMQIRRSGNSPLAQVNAMSSTEFYSRFSALLANNPPAAADQAMINILSTFGVEAGSQLEWGMIDKWFMTAGRWLAEKAVAKRLLEEQDAARGWIVPEPILGNYGTNYGYRAAVAMVGLGANRREDAIYLQAKTDDHGAVLSGSGRYQIHFKKDELPPVNAFWSITVYGGDHYFIDNAINRYSLGDRDPLVFNPDGSLDLWLQATPPTAKPQGNWLPIKEGEVFALSMRLYWPTSAALEGDWKMPLLVLLD